MEAAALFVLDGRLSAGLQPVQGARPRGEETKCVKVRATDDLRFDDLRDLFRGEAEGPCRMADAGRFQAIDHGPFVQPIAAEEGWPIERCPEEILEPGEEREALFWERRAVQGDATEGLPILGPSEEGAGLVASQDDIRAGVPLAKLGGAEGIIVEQEIVNGVPFAARGAPLVGVGPCPDPRFVRCGP